VHTYEKDNMTATPLQCLEASKECSSRFMSSLAGIQPYHILSNARAKASTSAQKGSQSLGKEMKFIIPVIIQQIWSGDKSMAQETAREYSSIYLVVCLFVCFMLASHSN